MDTLSKHEGEFMRSEQSELNLWPVCLGKKQKEPSLLGPPLSGWIREDEQRISAGDYHHSELLLCVPRKPYPINVLHDFIIHARMCANMKTSVHGVPLGDRRGAPGSSTAVIRTRSDPRDNHWHSLMKWGSSGAAVASVSPNARSPNSVRVSEFSQETLECIGYGNDVRETAISAR